MAARVFAAVDIGASGGRVMAGVVDPTSVTLHEVHRFPNGARRSDGHLRWDLTGLFGEVLEGLRLLARDLPDVESIGIDTWGVDYGLLDAEGALIAEPIAYRDDRTSAVIDAVHQRITPEELYAINGLQFLPFTTIYQLEAEKRSERWDRTEHAVLLPDLIAYWLTGELRTEVTNASTTGLLDVHSQCWSTELFDRLELPPDLLPPLQAPGIERGAVLPDIADRCGLATSTVVTTVGSHDTASAVVAVPSASDRFAYVASGTWSLVGLELAGPVLTGAARDRGFTNEGGVDGRTRFLRNVGGLWLLQESLLAWGAEDAGEGAASDLDRLLAEAASLPSGGPTIDVDDPAFIAPGDMPDRIAGAADRIAGAGGRPKMAPAQIVRCIIDSLATAFAATVQGAAELAGTDVDVIHIVGGGSQNELLCQSTADLAGRPVVAGPIEATAIGNVMVQARARGAAPASLEAMRAQVAASTPSRRYHPS